MTTKKQYAVLTATAHVPSTCWGRYGKVAVAEIDPAEVPADGRIKMISNRARGVVRIIQIWDRLYHGSTDRCAYRRACREAYALIAHLQRGR